MRDLSLKHAAGGTTLHCSACGGEAAKGAAVYLSTAEGEVMCRDCGASRAPVLAMLMELAELADRVGRISQGRGLWLPLDQLLELTRVAQDFHHAVSGPDRND